MIFVYLIILLISIDDIITTNISNSSSLNRVIIIPSCQADKTGLESIPKSSDRHSYFYFFSQSSSSLSSFLHLSYCEHQHTTYYSSSGFSILRSSPRLPSTDILDKEYSSSFHHHNAILSAVDQSSSPSSNMITTLMSSSSSSSKEKQHLGVHNNDKTILTTMNSLTTTFPNLSFIHSSLSTTATAAYKGNRTLNIMLLVACIAVGVLLLILIYVIIKYYTRDEGSYKIDESKNFATESHRDKTDTSGCSGKISAAKQHHHQKLLTTNEPNLVNSKEWYV